MYSGWNPYLMRVWLALVLAYDVREYVVDRLERDGAVRADEAAGVARLGHHLRDEPRGRLGLCGNLK